MNTHSSCFSLPFLPFQEKKTRRSITIRSQFDHNSIAKEKATHSVPFFAFFFFFVLLICLPACLPWSLPEQVQGAGEIDEAAGSGSEQQPCQHVQGSQPEDVLASIPFQ